MRVSDWLRERREDRGQEIDVERWMEGSEDRERKEYKVKQVGERKEDRNHNKARRDEDRAREKV